MLMMLAWPGWLLKRPRADAHDAGLAGVAAETTGLVLMMLAWPGRLLKGPRADAHDAGCAGVAAERATG